MSSSIIVAGIDVGGTAKGFHAVALRAGEYFNQFLVRCAEVADWCRQIDARYIGMDAPSHWRYEVAPVLQSVN